MVETGITPESHLDLEWQAVIRQGIRDALDNFELFGVINVSPLSISEGKDERAFLDLSEEEQVFIKDTLFEKIGFNPQKPESVTSYTIQAPRGAKWQGEANVKVYRTSREREGMFLHRFIIPIIKLIT